MWGALLPQAAPLDKGRGVCDYPLKLRGVPVLRSLGLAGGVGGCLAGGVAVAPTPSCPPSQGDLKRYLRAQRPPEGLSPELPPRDLRTLQRMGLEIARGLAHLHSHNYVHRWRLGSPGRGWSRERGSGG